MAQIILMSVLNKYKFSAKEKEAILTAAGILGLVSAAKNSIKNKIRARKIKLAESTNW